MENTERRCDNCCFMKNGACVMSKKHDPVRASDSAAERKCKKHLFKEVQK